MEISKNIKTVKLTKKELIEAVQVYLLAKDISGMITDITPTIVDISAPFNSYPEEEFIGISLVVES